jgi:hypothetical protein
MAMLRALFPQAIFIPKEQSVHTPVNLWSSSIISEVDALIDSGATDNFISPEVIQHFEIPTRQIDEPRTICNVDGSLNKIGSVTHATDLAMRYRNKTHIQTFYVVDLGEDNMLLGMPFLSATNPEIHWTNGVFKGKVEAATVDAHHHHFPEKAIEPVKMSNLLSESKYHTQFNRYINVEPQETQIQRTTKSIDLAIQQVDKVKRPWQQLVPREYHQYGTIFSEEESK